MTKDCIELWDEIKKYLPQYLSESDQKSLFEMLNNFENRSSEYFLDSEMETSTGIKQGDGLSDISYITLPHSGSPLKTDVIVLSNTCDISNENHRHYETSALYAPLVKLSKFKDLLTKIFPDDPKRIKDIIDTIKKQRKTDIFYVPSSPDDNEEYIVFLNSVCSSRLSHFRKEATAQVKKKFSLSQFGHYLFMLKLSVHFTRLGEGNCRVDHLSA